MLQIRHICKEYKTGTLVQKALDKVSLNLRDNEFVAILGPSGSGKTTLLNIIGGLDRYDSGDLIINGVSTKEYTDRDWDSYRNHTIGFVFQSYNLIPHQSVLSNVELALTISGISKAERRKRAARALEQMGLGDQLHKKPNQMSGGQMQRVAIARALVNDPDILLADEPTGALDSETSVQVMRLLKEVAKDRLVVMVTHNPELAETYATRTVKLRDGEVYSDSNPFHVDEETLAEPEHKNMGKSSMSFMTALALSFNNLKTKKARTLLTAFAGSIGIIGIALILSLSNGVNNYIKSIEEETLSEYPLQIQSTVFDLGSSMFGFGDSGEEKNNGEINVIKMVTNMFSSAEANDLASLKEYFDSGESGIEQYTSAVEYTYNITPQIYRTDGDKIRQIHPDKTFNSLGFGSTASSSSLMSMFMSTDAFYVMPENSDLYLNQYDVKAGRWPENYNECVLVLTSGGSISDLMLYTLGLRDYVELDTMIRQFAADESIETPNYLGSYTYDEILGHTFKLVNESDYFEYDEEYGLWKDKSDNSAFMRDLIKSGESITIVGLVQPAEGATANMLSLGIGYLPSLEKHVIEQAAASDIVKAQLANPEINVFTGKPFGEGEERGIFDLASLFSVDTDALSAAFGIDPSMFAVDLSGYLNLDGASIDIGQFIDLENIELDIDGLSDLNLGDIMGQIDITISSDDIVKLVSDFLSYYGEYTANNPEADFLNIGTYFMEYLQTPEARQLLAENIEIIIQSNARITVSPDQLAPAIQNIMAGYQAYAAANGLTDPDRFSEYLTEYLQTPDAQQRMTEAGENIIQIDGDLTASPEQLQALVDSLVAGYAEYAAANAMPDPSKLGDYFQDFLETPEARQWLEEALGAIADIEGLSEQISDALQGTVDIVTASINDVISDAVNQVMLQVSASLAASMQQAMSQIGANMGSAFSFDSEAFTDAVQMNMDGSELMELLMSLSSSEAASFDVNLKNLGYADMTKPGAVSIYPVDFSSKSHVIEILNDYNSRMEAENKSEKVIAYTDIAGTLMSSVTDIVDVISYVLVAFVSISLVVSSIMIGVITYISVLERKKEIGILRAIGASKLNISQVFNAETFIIGLCSGVLGITFTLLILIPGNQIIHSLLNQQDISAVLPVSSTFVLIALSVVLTLISGLLPSSKAAKCDPVTALRVE